MFCSSRESISLDETYLLEEVSAAGVFLRDAQPLAACVAEVAQPIILCGHSHLPRKVLLPDGKLIVNPGSVGLPAYTATAPYPHAMESGSPHAKYVILSKETDGW